jgi:ribosomal protein S18 acetylase RimI-like enzyme
MNTEIVDYKPEHQAIFEQIGREWIESIYVMEEEDKASLGNPQKYILDDGGCIVFIKHNNEIAGTVALIKKNDEVYEMVKMGVLNKFKGLGLGRILSEAIVAKAKTLGAKHITLHSNRKGSALAIDLYRKMGFNEVELEANAQWKRADIKMELSL